MSYAIVKNIKVLDDKVLVTSTDNNVYPRSYSEWTMSYRNENNPFSGKLQAEVEVMAGYEQGNFQGGSNKYTKALEVLLHMPEYKKFDWRGNWDKHVDKECAEYYQLLATALNTPQSKDKFIVSKIADGRTVYLKRLNKYSASFCFDKTLAKVFRYEEQAQRLTDVFPNSVLTVERI
jgi:hypothetical protein